MSNNHDGDAKFSVQIPQQVENRLCGIRVQCGGCLIRKKNLRVRRQGSCNRYTLLLPAGEL